MSFLSSYTTLGCKLEGTPYVAETLSAADYNVPARDIQIDPTIAMYARKLARGDMSKDPSIAGKKSGKITFKVDLAAAATVTTPPTYFKCLQGCAMKQVIGGSTVTLTTDASMTKTPLTFEYVLKDEGASPSQLVMKLRGCMGNAKLVMNNVGEPVCIEFEFTGVLVSAADRAFGSIMTPTGFDTALPQAVLSASIKTYGEAQVLSKVTINIGNKVELFTDPSQPEGFQGAHVVDRSPTLETDQDFTLIATNGDYARMTGSVTGSFAMDAGSHFNISAPAVQINKAYKPSEREGHVVNAHSYELKRNTGNDELVITHQ